MKSVATRLQALEKQARADWQRRMEAMTLEELDALIAANPVSPELDAAIQALSEAELERVVRGELGAADILQIYRKSRKRQGVALHGTEP